MTLLLTSLTDDSIITLSDRRLTRTDQGLITPYAEDAVKAICVSCANAHFAIGYTGLAEERAGYGWRTDRWLLETLVDMSAAEMRVSDLMEELRVRASLRFRSLKNLGRARATTFVAAGFNLNQPFAVMISNCEDADGQKLSEVSEEFSSTVVLRNKKPLTGFSLFVHGAEAAVDSELRIAIGKARKRYLNRGPEERLQLLLEIMRRAAANPSHGTYIGEDYQSVIIRPGEPFVAAFHPRNATTVGYAPHFISPGMVFRDVMTDSLAPEHSVEEPPWLRGIVVLSKRVTEPNQGVVPTLMLDHRLDGWGLFAEAKDTRTGPSPCIILCNRGLKNIKAVRDDERYLVLTDEPHESADAPNSEWFQQLSKWLIDSGFRRRG